MLLRHNLKQPCHFGAVVIFSPYLREHTVLPYELCICSRYHSIERSRGGKPHSFVCHSEQREESHPRRTSPSPGVFHKGGSSPLLAVSRGLQRGKTGIPLCRPLVTFPRWKVTPPRPRQMAQNHSVSKASLETPLNLPHLPLQNETRSAGLSFCKDGGTPPACHSEQREESHPRRPHPSHVTPGVIHKGGRNPLLVVSMRGPGGEYEPVGH